jgi:hypothetical protein
MTLPTVEPEFGIRYLTATAAAGGFVAKLNTGSTGTLRLVEQATDLFYPTKAQDSN